MSKVFKPVSYTIDCSEPVQDTLIDMDSFEAFLVSRIKAVKRGKAGVLGDKIAVSKDDSVITVTIKAPMAKKYLKYLTKKFLKKNSLRDYVRVISNSKNSYYLRYFVPSEGAEAEE